MKCSKCDYEYDDRLSACPLCGQSAGGGNAGGANAESATAAKGNETREKPSASDQEKSGATPLVLGILSIVVPYAGIVLGILAMVFGSAQRRQYPRGTSQYSFAQVGWILGIISVCVYGALIVMAIVAMATAASFLTGALGFAARGLRYFW